LPRTNSLAGLEGGGGGGGTVEVVMVRIGCSEGCASPAVLYEKVVLRSSKDDPDLEIHSRGSFIVLVRCALRIIAIVDFLGANNRSVFSDFGFYHVCYCQFTLKNCSYQWRASYRASA
jgi:hypothetical protein